MTRLLDLFAGTHSVGSLARELGFEVTSLDLCDADVCCDVLEWDYKSAFEPKHFDVIWASPPCDTFSHMRQSLIGRHGYSAESLQTDIEERGLPLLYKTLEIIDYLSLAYGL